MLPTLASVTGLKLHILHKIQINPHPLLGLEYDNLPAMTIKLFQGCFKMFYDLNTS